MRPLIFRIAHALMGIVAFAWPLDVYQHVPLTGASVVSIVGGALVLLWALDLIIHRAPRVPFELFWPVVALAVGAIALRIEHAWTIAGICALFLAVLHFARDRETIERWLIWSATTCLVAALADIAYRMGYGWPTAYAVPVSAAQSPRALDAISATSGTLANGSATLIAGALLWLAIVTRGTFSRAMAAICCIAITYALCAHAVGLFVNGPADPGHWLRIEPPSLLIGGLALWLLARVAAKLVVDRMRGPDGSYALVAAPLVAVAAVAAWGSIAPMGWHAWAAALAAGYAIRDKRPAPEVSGGQFGTYTLIAILPIGAANAYFVDPSNAYDGRNYVQDLREDYSSGTHEELMARIEFWHQRAGNGPAQHFWATLAALDADRPHAAAGWSSRLSRRITTHPQRHPIPSGAELERLLNRFRDHVSAMPEGERGVAYERALAACGDADAAAASLRQRIAGANPVYEEIERAPLQHAVEFLFQDIRPLVDFTGWSIAELIAVLDLVDARVETAPPEIDRSWLPASIAVRRDARVVAIAAESQTSRASGSYESVCRLNRTPGEFADDRWRTAALPFDASWQITLHGGNEDAQPIVTATFADDGGVEILLPENANDSVPDEPAVFVWLP